MSHTTAIDTHAHILSEETMRMIAAEAPKVAPKLTPIDKDFAILEVAGTPYRPFPRGGWDMERRLEDMAFSDVDVQVLSNTPQTFLYNQDAVLNAILSALQNDQIAKAVASHPGRFQGIATLPMQAPQKAADELNRAMRTLGLKGAHIGSNINGKNLDDPEFEVLWATANELDAFIMVHPTQVAGADRLKSYYLTNLIGNPLDSTIAAASLVFSGVVERYPGIKFLFVHGGGFVPWQMGRFSHGWHVRPEPQLKLKQPPEASLNRLYFDSILHARPQLECLVALAGPERVVLGSDYPFDMGTLECARQVKALSIRDVDKAAILSGTPLKLLGEAAPSSARANIAHG
jgi:aminocarboxymuconate-semialdehyde decarboxylase